MASFIIGKLKDFVKTVTGSDAVNSFKDMHKDAVRLRHAADALLDNLRNLQFPSNVDDLNKLIEAANKKLQKDVAKKTFTNPWQPYLWLAVSLIQHASDIRDNEKSVEPLLRFCGNVVKSKEGSNAVYLPKKLRDALLQFVKKPLATSVRLGNQTVPTLDLIGLVAFCIVESKADVHAPDDWWHSLCDHVISWILSQSQRVPPGAPALPRRTMLEVAIRDIQKFLSSCHPVGRNYDVFFASLISAVAAHWKGCDESIDLLAFVIETFASQTALNAATMERHLKQCSERICKFLLEVDDSGILFIRTVGVMSSIQVPKPAAKSVTDTIVRAVVTQAMAEAHGRRAQIGPMLDVFDWKAPINFAKSFVDQLFELAASDNTLLSCSLLLSLPAQHIRRQMILAMRDVQVKNILELAPLLTKFSTQVADFEPWSPVECMFALEKILERHSCALVDLLILLHQVPTFCASLDQAARSGDSWNQIMNAVQLFALVPKPLQDLHTVPFDPRPSKTVDKLCSSFAATFVSQAVPASGKDLAGQQVLLATALETLHSQHAKSPVAISLFCRITKQCIKYLNKNNQLHERLVAVTTLEQMARSDPDLRTCNLYNKYADGLENLRSKLKNSFAVSESSSKSLLNRTQHLLNSLDVFCRGGLVKPDDPQLVKAAIQMHLENIEITLQQIQDMILYSQWLSDFKFIKAPWTPTIPDDPSEDDLAQLLQTAPAKPSSNTSKAVLFLKERQTKLLDVLTQSAIDASKKQNLTVADADMILNQVIKKLVDLTSPSANPTLEDFSKISSKCQNIKLELDVAAMALHGTKGMDEEAIQNLRSRMDLALSLLRFKDGLLPLLTGLEKSQNLIEEKEKIASVRRILGNLSGVMPLSQAQQVKAELDGLFGTTQFRPHHVELIAEFFDAEAIASFLHKYAADKQRINVMLDQLQTDRESCELLRAVLAAGTHLAPLLNYRYRREKPFLQLCAELAKACNEQKVANQWIAYIKQLQANLINLRTLFLSRDDNLRFNSMGLFLPKWLGQGQFLSIVQPDASAYLTFSAEKKEVDMKRVEDVVTMMRIFPVESSGVVTQETVNTFLSVFDLCKKVNSVHAKLVRWGFPLYVDKAFELPTPLAQDAYVAKLNHIKDLYRAWKTTLQNLVEDCNRLLFLSPRALGRFIARFSSIPVDPSSKDLRYLSGILMLIFPDAWNERNAHGELVLSDQIIKDAIAEAAPQDIEPLSEQSVVDWLNCTARFLSDLARKAKNGQKRNTNGFLKLVRAFSQEGVTPSVLLQWLIQEPTSGSDTAPHPSTLLWCSPITTPRDVATFFSRALSSWRLGSSFFIVQVNLLSLDARRELLQLVQNLEAKNQPINTKLYLVFTDTSGLDLFSFLDHVSVAGPVEAELQLDRAGALSKLINVPHLSVFMSEPSVGRIGKSYTIEKRLKHLKSTGAVDGVVRVAVNEAWDYSMLISFLKTSRKKGWKSIGVHFNVSAYAPHSRLDRFFLNFLGHAAVIDDVSGKVEMVSPDTKWYLFVEISVPPEADARYRDVSSVQAVRDCLPSLRFFKCTSWNPVIEAFNYFDDPSWIASLSAIAAWIPIRSQRRNQVPAIDQFYEEMDSLIDPPLIATNDDAQLAFDTLVGYLADTVPICADFPNRRAFFILMSERVTWLKGYAAFAKRACQDPEQGQTTLAEAHNLVDELLFEAARWSSPDTKLHDMIRYPFYVRRVDSTEVAPVEPLPEGATEEEILIHSQRLADYHQDVADSVMYTFSVLHASPDATNYWDPARLRSELGWALGMSDTSQVVYALKQRNFILTHDLAYRLCLLHERRNLGMNFIMSGATGVGKTELFAEYASLCNVESAFAIGDAVIAAIFDALPRNAPAQLKDSLELCVKRDHDAFPHLKEYLEAAVGVICESPADPDALTPGVAAASRRLGPALIKIVHSFPDLHITSTIRKIWNATVDEFQAEEDIPFGRSLLELKNCVTAVAFGRFDKIFHHIKMHAGMSAAEFKKKVLHIKELAEQLEVDMKQSRPNAVTPSIVVFIDEGNTTRVMGWYKEVVCDGTLDGRRLPSNLFFVSAINPFKPPTIGGNSSDGHVLDYANTKSEIQEYVVRPLHSSMGDLLVDFGDYRRWQELQFLHYLSLEEDTLGSETNRRAFRSIIGWCQQFVRTAAIQNVAVSIRDCVRALQLFKYFCNSQQGKFLLNLDGLVMKGDAERAHVIFWRSLLLAVGLAYFYRLPACGSSIDFSISMKNHSDEDLFQELSLLLEQGVSTRVQVQRQGRPAVVFKNSDSVSSLLLTLAERCFFSPLSAECPFSTVLEDCHPQIDAMELALLKDTETYYGTVHAFQRWAIRQLRTSRFGSALLTIVQSPKYGRFYANSKFAVQYAPRLASQLASLENEGINKCGADFDVEFDFRRVFLSGLENLFTAQTLLPKAPRITAGDAAFLRNSAGKAQPSNVLLAVLSDCERALYNRARIPDEIAPTQGLLSNFFIVIVSIDSKIPFTILGPAGASKTLSFVLAERCLSEGELASKALKTLRRLHPFRYQCSPYSSDTQIEARYLDAIAQQERADSLSDGRLHCCVFVDEAGLPDENRQALKVMHYYLDNPIVASLLITNTMLDAAKVNRTGLLQLPTLPPSDDLERLARATLGLPVQETMLKSESIIRGICNAHRKSNQFSAETRSELYQHRDLIYFLRSLRELLVDRTKLQIEHPGTLSKALVEALFRNYGGIAFEQFSSLVKCFFDEIREACRKAHPDFIITPPSFEDRTLTTLKNALTAATEQLDSLVAARRYVAIIDETDSEAGVYLFLQQLEPEMRAKVRTVTVGDFAADRGDRSLSAVISTIIKAMARGRIIVLLNSGPIRTTLYDVFNRFFKRVPGEDGQYSEYANVASGSESTSCLVHPDFKIVVHIPLSEMSSCPLPFLDRFEKYRVSVRQALQQKIASANRGEDAAVADAKYKANFQTLRQGVQHMVDTLHTKESMNKLLSHFDEETLDSLILRTFEHSVKSGIISAPPRVPFSFSEGDIFEKAETETDNVDRVNFEEPGATPSQKKRQLVAPPAVETSSFFKPLIRQLNFALMQIARPEAFVQISKLLPDAYKIEYLFNQEHFSFLRFASRHIQAAFDPESIPNVPAEVSRKWIVYSRSCSALLQVKSTPNVAAALHQWFDEVLPKKSGKKLEVIFMSLSTVTSSRACRRQIKEFVSGCSAETPKVLTCAVDMQACTRHQLNYLRYCVDELVVSPQAMVFIVLYFPPELYMTMSTGYAPVFLNDWDFASVDSLGLREGLQEKATPTTSSFEIDAKAWVGLSFGIRSRSFGDIHVEAAVEATFFELIEMFCLNSPPWIYIPYVPKAKVNSSQNERYPKLKQFFDQNKSLYTNTVSRYTKVWSRSLLQDLIRQISQQVQTGGIVSSFVAVIQRTLRQLMAPLVFQTCRDLVSYYNILTVSEILDSHREDAQMSPIVQFIHVMMTNIVMPTHVDWNKLYETPPTFLKFAVNTAPKLPFSDIIMESIHKAIRAARWKSSSFVEILGDTRLAVSQTPVIGRAVAMIEKHQELFQAFKEDFITRSLRLPLSGSLLDVAVTVVDNIGSEGPVGILLYQHFYAEQFYLFNSLMDPIKLLPKKEMLIWEPFRRRISEFGIAETMLDSLPTIVSEMTIDLLRQSLVATIADFPTSPDQCFENLNEWCRAIRSWRSSVKVASFLAEVDAGTAETMRTMLALFLCRLNYGLSAQALMDVLVSKEIQAALCKCSLDISGQNTRFNHLGQEIHFEYLLQLLDAIRIALEKCPGAKEKHHHLIQDIFGVYLFDYSKYSNTDLPESTAAVISKLIHVCADIKDPLCEALPLTWRFHALHCWLKRVPDSWREDALHNCAKTILALRGQDVTAPYTFDPCLLGGLDVDAVLASWDIPIPTIPPASALETMLYQLFLADEPRNEPLEAYALRYEQLCRNPVALTLDTKVELVLETLKQAAVGVSLLKEFSSVLCNAQLSPSEIVGNLRPSVRDVIRRMLGTQQGSLHFPHGAIRHAWAYVLYHADIPSRLRLLRSEELLDTLGLRQKWLVADRSSLDMSLFSFMLEEQSADGKLYAKVRGAVLGLAPLANVLAVADQGQSEKYNLRMFFPIAIFHECFKLGRSCAAVQGALEAVSEKLSLSPRERALFSFLCDGPQAKHGEISPEWTPANFMPNSKNSGLAALMVSTISITLGCPPQKTHLYKVIFEPEKVGYHTDWRCPGSDWSERFVIDCGFQSDRDKMILTRFDNINPVMLNNECARLVLNIITWCGWCWPMLLSSGEDCQRTTESWLDPANHFLNAIADYKQAYIGENLNHILQQYVQIRPLTFLQMLSENADITSLSAVPTHFVTECMLALRNLALSPHCPSELQLPHNDDKQGYQRAIGFENVFLRRIYEHVQQNYRELAKFYTTSVAAIPQLAVTINMDSIIAGNFLSPIVDHSVVDYKLCREHENTFCSVFLHSIPRFAVLHYIPPFYAFYHSLYKLFEHRLTKEQIGLSVPACLDLVRDLETAEDCERFIERWESFKDLWRQAKLQVGQLAAGCQYQAGRAFELEIIEIDDTTPLSELITDPTGQGNDAIMRLIDSFTVQERILTQRQLCSDLNFDELVYDEDPWCQPGVDRSVYALQVLSERNPGRFFFGSDWNADMWSHFVAAHASFGDVTSLTSAVPQATLTVDFERVQRQMLEMSSGKVNFSGQLKKADKFKLKPEDFEQADVISPAQVNASNQLGAVVARIPRHGTALSAPLNRTTRVGLDRDLKPMSNTEQGCANLVRAMSVIVDYLASVDPETDEARFKNYNVDDTTFGEIVGHIPSSASLAASLACLRETPICHLRDVCLLINERVRARDYLFVNITNDLCSPLEDEFENKQTPLSSTHAQLLTKPDGLKRALECAVTLMNHLWPDQDFDRAALMTCIAADSDKSLSKLLQKRYPDLNLPVDVLSSLLPLSVKGRHYSVVLRVLHEFCGQLAFMVKNQCSEMESADSRPSLYTEYVPPELFEGPLQDTSFENSDEVVPPASSAYLGTAASTWFTAIGHQDTDYEDPISSVDALRAFPRGIKNPHLICYAISALQSLFAVHCLRDALFASNGLLSDLAAAIWTSQSNDPVSSDKVVVLIQSFGKESFRLGLQNDVHEFLTYLLSSDEHGKVLSPYASIKLQQTRTCSCGAAPISVSVVDLCIGIDMNARMVDLMALLESSLTSKGEAHCDVCCKNAPFDIQLKFEAAPKVLCLQLKRFEYVNGQPLKLQQMVRLQPFIELPSELFVDGRRIAKYALRSISTHLGNVNRGHCTTFLEAPSGWHEVDDNHVISEDPWDTRVSTSAYLLFYELIEESVNVPQPQPVVKPSTPEVEPSSSSSSSTSSSQNVAVPDLFVLPPTILRSIPGTSSSTTSTVLTSMLAASLPESSTPLSIPSTTTPPVSSPVKKWDMIDIICSEQGDVVGNLWNPVSTLPLEAVRKILKENYATELQKFYANEEPLFRESGGDRLVPIESESATTLADVVVEEEEGPTVYLQRAAVPSPPAMATIIIRVAGQPQTTHTASVAVSEIPNLTVCSVASLVFDVITSDKITFEPVQAQNTKRRRPAIPFAMALMSTQPAAMVLAPGDKENQFAVVINII